MGYRTKAYTSRREKHHPGQEFNITTVQYILKNLAYIGKKEVNKRKRVQDAGSYRLVDAVWPGIVDAEKFERVQRLMAANGRSGHNESHPVRHSYVLNSGLLKCGRCGSPMEGRSGTGRLGSRYYYYACRNKDCGLRVAADEVEGAVLGRIQALAREEAMLDALVAETNRRLSQQRPSLASRRRALEKNLNEVKAQADKLLTEWSSLEGVEGRAFLLDKLGDLARRRRDLDAGLAEGAQALQQLEGEEVTAATVRGAFVEFGRVYSALTPFERKELIRLVLCRAEVGDRKIVLELYPIQAPKLAAAQSPSRSEPANWLPGQDSNLQPSG